MSTIATENWNPARIVLILLPDNELPYPPFTAKEALNRVI